MLQWPLPKTVKRVKDLLGLTGYYCKFICDYGKIVKLLIELTKKDGVMWKLEAQKAFEEVKLRLTTPALLALPNFE